VQRPAGDEADDVAVRQRDGHQADHERHEPIAST
jgi:hypothetical protein